MRLSPFYMGCVTTCAVVGVGSAWSLAADLTRVWDNGAPTTNWTDGDNWDPDTPGGPVNGGGDDYFVEIPGGFLVVYDNAGNSNITELSLSNTSSLRLTLSNNLNVLDGLTLGGTIDARGGHFSASNAAFDGNQAQIEVTSGSMVTVDALNYTVGFIASGTNFLSVNGAGSSLNLDELLTLDAAFDRAGSNGNVQRIAASNNGQMDLSVLETVDGPGGNDILDFDIDSGGSIDLSALATIASLDGTGQTRFLVDNISTSVSLPSLTSVDRVRFQARTGGQITADSLTSYTTTFFASGTHLLEANGTGGQLNLPALVTLDAGFDRPGSNGNVQEIVATSGGHIDLSSLETVHGPGGNDILDFDIDGGGTIDLSSLVTIDSLDGTGQTRFLVDNISTSVSLPSLTSVDRVRFLARTGGQITVESLASYTTSFYSSGTHLLEASSTGAQLNLPALVTLDAGFDRPGSNGNIQEIVATNNGHIDLSSLETVHGPGGNDILRFDIDNGGSIDLSSLETIDSLDGTGQTQFLVDNISTSVSLPSLTSVDRVRFLARTGGQITAESLASYTTTFFSNGEHLMEASGTGAQLNLSGLVTFDAAFDRPGSNGNVQEIVATSNGHIDLSALDTIHGPGGNDILRFDIDNGGSIDLSSLETIDSLDGTGQTQFLVDNISTSVSLPSLTNVDRVRFLARTGGQIIAESLASYTTSFYSSGTHLLEASGTGAQLNLPGLVTLDAAFDRPGSSGNVQQVVATSNGHIDLSSLATVHGPGGNDILDFDIDGGGSIDFSSLETIDSLDGTGRTRFLVDGVNTSVSLPSLTNVSRTLFLARTGGQITAESLASYTTTFFSNGEHLFEANGTGAQLNLPSLVTINAAFDRPGSNGNVQEIVATSNGHIDLSSLATIHGPGGNDILRFDIDNGGTIDLSSLATIDNLDGTGQTQILVDNISTSVSLPSLTSADRLRLLARTGGQITADSLAIYTTTFFSSGTHLLEASGTGAELNLPALVTLDAAFDRPGSNGNVQEIVAASNGQIDLSSLETIHGPGGNDILSFDIDSGASVDLSSLETIDSLDGTGRTRFLIDNSTVIMGPLVTAERVTFDMNFAAHIDAPGDLSLGSGVELEIQVGPGGHSTIDVVGTATLGASLEVARTTSSFVPTLGSTFDVITADEIDGKLSLVTGHLFASGGVTYGLAPVVERGAGNDPDVLMLVMAVAGDADLNGRVDAADLNALALSWQKMVMDGWLDADFTGDMVVDAADLNLLALNWQFGVVAPSAISFEQAWSAALANVVIPEPGSGLAAVVVGGLALARIFHRRDFERGADAELSVGSACRRGGG